MGRIGRHRGVGVSHGGEVGLRWQTLGVHLASPIVAVVGRGDYRPPNTGLVIHKQLVGGQPAQAESKTSALSMPRWSNRPTTSAAKCSNVMGRSMSAVRPWPCNSTAITRWDVASTGIAVPKLSSMVSRPPCSRTSGGPSPCSSLVEVRSVDVLVGHIDPTLRQGRTHRCVSRAALDLPPTHGPGAPLCGLRPAGWGCGLPPSGHRADVGHIAWAHGDMGRHQGPP